MKCFKRHREKDASTSEGVPVSTNDVQIQDEKDENDALYKDRFNVNRELYNYPKFTKAHMVGVFVGFSLLEALKDLFTKHIKPGRNCMKKTLFNRIPALRWIKNYRVKEYLLADLLAGLTVGIMHIPQGMAYALLASLPPIYGLYTSFYPVLIYWIFGTSRQLSMGTFAVVSLMVANVLADLEPKYAPPVGFNRLIYEENLKNNISNGFEATHFLSDDREKARVLIVMANAFCVGIVQLIMFVFQLGFLTSYLSEPFVNSYLAGCAVHVFTSQMKFLFGIHLTSFVGILKIPKTYIELFLRLNETNVATITITIICVSILLSVKIFVNERYSTKMPVPFPTELVIVVLGTIISFSGKFQENFHVKTVGPIPAGLPKPELPPVFIFKDMIMHSILIAVVAFSINFSLCDLFSKKDRYKINNTQELLAYGATNVFSSFFPCFASGASLARSCVQYNAGGKTQLVSIVSCVIVGLVLAFIAPVFKELPQACLASIIVVSLKTLFANLGQLPYYWKVNKIEFFLFLLTFLSVSFLDVDIGLGIGVGFTILAHIVRSTQPYATLLGHIPGTEFYKDIKLYKDAHELYKIKIVRVQTELHATNSAIFRKSIYELTKVKPQPYIEIKNKINKYKKKLEDAKNPKSEFKFIMFLPEVFKRLLLGNKSSKRVYKEETPFVFVINDAETKLGGARSVNVDLHGDLPMNNKLEDPEEIYMTEYERNEHEAEKRNNADTESQIVDHNYGVISIDKLDYDKNREGIDSDYDPDEIRDDKLRMPRLEFNFLIIDCSPINFVDTVGVKTIKQIISDYNEIGIRVYLADCNDAVRHRFKLMENALPKKERVKFVDEKFIHLSIHDAVLHALNTRRFLKDN